MVTRKLSEAEDEPDLLELPPLLWLLHLLHRRTRFLLRASCLDLLQPVEEWMLLPGSAPRWMQIPEPSRAGRTDRSCWQI